MMSVLPPTYDSLVSPTLAAAPMEHTSVRGAPPTYQADERSLDQRLLETVERLEIKMATVEELGVISMYDTALLCDDSGSMSHHVHDEQRPNARQTRWEELRETTATVVELATALDSDGIDLYFLNRIGARNVNTYAQIAQVFEAGPHGSTPLVARIKDILREHAARGPNAKKLLLVIATDGQPNEGVEALMDVLNRRDTSRVAVSILACTDDDDAVGYLNDIDKRVPGVDVLDDFFSERKEVLRAGRVTRYSRGDHCARLLLGPISDKWDKLDESASVSISATSSTRSTAPAVERSAAPPAPSAAAAVMPTGGAGAGAAPVNAAPAWWDPRAREVRRALTVTCHRAAGLLAGDRSGTSDPYVKVTIDRSEVKSRVIKKTLAPVWNEALVLAPPFTPSSHVMIKVFDKDLIGSDLLGMVMLRLDETFFDGPREFALGGQAVDRQTATGTVTLSFQWGVHLS